MTKTGCYAVATGRKPGVYMDWSDCEAQVLNFKGAKYRKFLNAADAELWLHENAIGPYSPRNPNPITTAPAADLSVSALPSLLKTVETRFSSSFQGSIPGSTPSAAKIDEASSSFRSESRVNFSSPQTVLRHPIDSLSDTSPTTTMPLDTIIVYTDGSCKSNGKVGSAAGVGVWWGEGDPGNISERCPGEQTNNRAELIAIIRALERAPTNWPLVIKSDSEYSINCATRWIWGWKTKGWRKSDGKSVQNIPLLKYLDVLLDERRRVFKLPVEFVKVLGHSKITGNEEADRLANEGAMLPPLPDRDWEALTQQVHARIDAAASSTFTSTSKSVPRTASTPSKTKIYSSPKLPVTPMSRVPAEPAPPLVASTYKSSPPSTVASVSNASLSVSRQSSVLHTAFPASRPASSISRAASSAARVASTSTSASERKPRTPLPLSDVSIHESLDVKISQRELEAYAACVLDDDEFLREAQEAGIC